jgi:Raf kinase inhibitor-like YbhB/YbcL family protein
VIGRFKRLGQLRRLERMVTAAAALAFAVPLAGCGLLGSGITVTAPSVMTVSSATMPRNILPDRYTCAAPKALSPPLNWAGAPSGTKSIAIVVDDANAPISPYVYWVVFNIRPAASAILEGQVPLGARQAKGSAGLAHYVPPCPGPHGHGYRFTVYALKSVLNLPNGTSLISAWRAIAAATIGRGRLPVFATS